MHLFIATFFSLAIYMALYAQSSELNTKQDGMPPNSYLINASDLLRKRELEVRKFAAQHPEAIKSIALHKTAWTFVVGSTKSWYADNFITGKDINRYLVPSTCRAVGNNCYIFVEDSSWIKGRVTQTVVDSVRIYFDSKTPADPSKGIYQLDTETFGDPPNVDGDPKIIILLLDIKDGFSVSGGFVGGYFYSYNELGFSTSNHAEIFFIDTYPLNLTSQSGLRDGISILAHEFQHMIHFNYNYFVNHKTIEDLTFIDEGCSLVAEVNCGFPIYNPMLYANETNHYLLDWRDDINKVLNDYSRAARFFVYLRDQAGIGVFKKIVASTQIGTARIDDGLSAIGSPLRFNGILQNWFIANILNDRSNDPSYGYIYPNLPKSAGLTFTNPNVALTSDSVDRYAVKYLDFKTGSQLHFTFTSSSSNLIVKAIEIGSSNKQVVDVAKGIEFTEPLFGTTYKEIYFAFMDTSATAQSIYSYSASGADGINQTTISYAGNQGNYMLLPSANKKLAVRFSPTVSGQLFTASVKLNYGLDAKQGNGKLRVSACQNDSGSIGGIPGAIIGTYVEVPFSQLNAGSWNDIDMQNANVPITAGTDFHIVVEVNGISGDTLQILLDDGKSQINRSSSYRIGNNGLRWYNRADPNYGGGKPISYENLFITASIATSTVVTDAAVQIKLPLRYELEQNYPNPFNPSTVIRFQMPSKGFVTLKVYDIIGREVVTLVNGSQEAGTHEVKLNASNLPSGVYFYRIITGAFAETKKLVLIK
jgi:hypothetical protein